MVVYIDYIFIENIVMNFFLLFQVRKLAKVEASFLKLVISSLIGAIYVCVMYLLKINILNYAIMKLLLSFVMVYIAFLPSKLNKYIKLIILFYFILVINTGTYLVIINMFDIKSKSEIIKIAVYVVGAIFIQITNLEVWRIFKLNLRKENLTCNVCIKNKGKYIRYKGLIDTGNTSTDLKTGKYIFYANMRNDLDLSEYETVSIDVNTVNGKDSMLGYVVKDILIMQGKCVKETEAVICFLDKEIVNKLGYDMIVNFGVYEELIGGISI